MSIELPPLPSLREWPHSREELRARDIEVARLVLEAAANFCDDEYRTPDGWGTTAADRRCATGIRELEVSHAD